MRKVLSFLVVFSVLLAIAVGVLWACPLLPNGPVGIIEFKASDLIPVDQNKFPDNSNTTANAGAKEGWKGICVDVSSITGDALWWRLPYLIDATK